jgi:hypothetical protein
MHKNSFFIDYDTEIGEIIVNVSAFNQKTGVGINLKLEPCLVNPFIVLI